MISLAQFRNTVASWFVIAIILFCMPHAASAEPPWGESPQTFAFGVYRPEVQFGVSDQSHLTAGSNALSNPSGLGLTRMDTQFLVQYALRTQLNLIVQVPYTSVWAQQRIAGQRHTLLSGGLGDMVVTAKSRFYQKFTDEWKMLQSYSVGLQLPTGAAGGHYPDGTALAPSEQAASGKPGIVLGYAFSFERFRDQVWVSLKFRHEIGGVGVRGDSLILDAPYGYWLQRPRTPKQMGITVVGGPHLEISGKDQIHSGSDPNTGSTMVGLQTSVIATQGPCQLRAGVMIPLYQHVNGSQLGTDLQFRLGFAIFH